MNSVFPNGRFLDCSKCGHHNPNQHKFCSECGATLFADKQEAERRSLTVMFCDLVGSTALSERFDPEDLQRLLSAYQDCCRLAIRHYEGYIARYMGDGLLVYFGYPTAHEDDARRSVSAALEIVSKVPSLSILPDCQPAVRIGIATGDVVIGDVVGEGTAEERAVLGLTPNLAARLQGVADKNEIVVSAGTLPRLASVFQTHDLGTFSLKGISRPTQAWRIDGIAKPGTPVRTVSPFVGRKKPLEQLERALQASLENAAQVVHLSGQPGIGKTRFLSEFLSHHEEYAALEWTCSAFHCQVPLHPVPEHWQRTQAATVPAGESRRRILFAAILDQLMIQAKAKPLILVVEDAHWIDPTTRELLTSLPRLLRHSRVLIIVSSRPCADTEQLATTMGGNRLALQALANEEANALVLALVNHSVSPAACEKIIARAGGLPLFLEQLAAVVSQNQDNDIPDSLQESLLAKLDKLGPTKRLAQLASLFGRSFSPAELGRLKEVNTHTLDDNLQQFLTAGLVDRTAAGYTFRHALMQEVAYETLLRSTRSRLHGEIADHLIKSSEQTAPELLARHLSAAKRHAEAAPFWCRAAHHSAALWAHQEAASYYLAALEYLPQMTDENGPAASLGSDHWELTTRLDLVDSLRIIDRYDAALQQLDLAETLAERIGNDTCLLRLHVLRGNILFPLGESARCAESQQKALAIAKKLQDPEAEARAYSSLGDAHFTGGRMVSAERAYDACIELASAHLLPQVQLTNISIRGHMRLYLCRIDEAEADCRLAVEMALDAGNRRAQMTALGSCLGKVLLEKGLFSDADEAFSRAAVLASELGAFRFEALNLAFRGKVALATGDRTQALLQGTRAVHIARRSGPRFCLPLAIAVVARAETSLPACSQALGEAQALIQEGCVAHNPLWFYRDAALAMLAHGKPVEARRYAQQLITHFADEPLPWCQMIANGIAGLVDRWEHNDHSGIDTAIEQAEQLGYAGWAHCLRHSSQPTAG